MNSVRFKIKIAYEGTNFFGWAKQNVNEIPLRTVEFELEKVLSLVARENVNLTVAGRTDAGVHAMGQVAHFDLSEIAAENFFHPHLLSRLNKLLPKDIRIINLAKTTLTFNARFAALSRTYIYYIHQSVYGCLPLERNFVAAWNRKLDVSLLNTASQSLLGLNDFAAFCKPKPRATTIRNLLKFSWTEPRKNFYKAVVRADAFGWNMVRSLVGAVTAVATGKKSLSWCENLLAAKERNSEIVIAPACGLTLYSVQYPSIRKYSSRIEETKQLRNKLDKL